MKRIEAIRLFLVSIVSCVISIALPQQAIYAQTNQTPLVCLCIADIEAGSDQCAKIATRDCGFSDGVLRPIAAGDPAPDPVCLPFNLLNRCETVLSSTPKCGSTEGSGAQVTQAFLCSGVGQ